MMAHSGLAELSGVAAILKYAVPDLVPADDEKELPPFTVTIKSTEDDQQKNASTKTKDGDATKKDEGKDESSGKGMHYSLLEALAGDNSDDDNTSSDEELYHYD